MWVNNNVHFKWTISSYSLFVFECFDKNNLPFFFLFFSWASAEFDLAQIRLIVYQDCERRGRQVLFDSKAVHKLDASEPVSCLCVCVYVGGVYEHCFGRSHMLCNPACLDLMTGVTARLTGSKRFTLMRVSVWVGSWISITVYWLLIKI